MTDELAARSEIDGLDDPKLTPAEAASMVGASVRSIHRWSAAGSFPRPLRSDDRISAPMAP